MNEQITMWIGVITAIGLGLQRLIECINQMKNTQEAKGIIDAVTKIIQNFMTIEKYYKKK